MRAALAMLGLIAMGLCAGGPAWSGVSIKRASDAGPGPVLSAALHAEIALVRREMDAELRALVDGVPREERGALRELLRHPDLTAALEQTLGGRSSGPLARRLRAHPRALRSLVFRVAMRTPWIVPRIESIRARSRAHLEELLLLHPLRTRAAARALLQSPESDHRGER